MKPTTETPIFASDLRLEKQNSEYLGGEPYKRFLKAKKVGAELVIGYWLLEENMVIE